MSDLDRFELFTYVAQYGSLTQAALALGMSKTALSKQIKQLEANLKMDLFSRQSYRLQLTESGKVLLAQCLRLKKELDEARAICQQMMYEPEGTLKVVVFEYFAQRLIYPKLANFLRKYPKLEINLLVSESIPNFEQEQVDLAIGFSLPAGDEIVRSNIMNTRYVLCGAPAYFKKYGVPKDLNSLAQHHYIGHSSRSADRTIHLKPPHKLILKPKLLLNNVAGMIECAQQGIGIIQLPHYLLDSSLQKGELVEVLKNYQADRIPVYYYYPRYRYIQPKVRKFIDFFLQE